MKHAFRALALALALAATPACATLGGPVPAHATAEQSAYALIGGYVLTLEEATALVKNPPTPRRVKDALSRAEAAATPAVELVKIAAIAHRRARTESTGAASAHALAEAQAPARALGNLVSK